LLKVYYSTFIYTHPVKMYLLSEIGILPQCGYVQHEGNNNNLPAVGVIFILSSITVCPPSFTSFKYDQLLYMIYLKNQQ